MLRGELDGGEWILDLVRDLPRHFAPRFQAVRAQDLRHILGDEHLLVAVRQRHDGEAEGARVALRHDLHFLRRRRAPLMIVEKM